MSDFEAQIKDLRAKADAYQTQASRILNKNASDPTAMPDEDIKYVETCHEKAEALWKRAEVLEKHAKAEAKAFSAASPTPEQVAESAVRMKSGPVSGSGEYTPRMYTEARESEQKSLFAKFVRNGFDSLESHEKAALVEESGGASNGEALVPEALAGPIFKVLPNLSQMRQAALIRPTTSNRVNVRNLSNGSVGWGKLETGATPAEGAGSASTEIIEVFDLNTLVKIGVDELADSDANLAALIQEQVAALMAEEEDIKLATGSGTGEPTGIDTVSFTGRELTSGGYTLSNASKVRFKVKSRYRMGGVYIGSSAATEALMSEQEGTGTGQFVWSDPTQGEPSTLFGHRYYEVPGLPGTGAGTPGLIFGHFRSSYMIVDRQRLTVTRLNELYRAQGQIGLLFTLRVGAAPIRDEAFAAVKATA